MVPECLFQPTEQPLCPDSGFWFRGQQHSEPYQVPNLGSVSYPWEVPLSTTMPHDILWSYLAFWVVSVSGFALLLSFLSSIIFEVCHSLPV